MERELNEILKLDSLGIGYFSGKKKFNLLSPLSASGRRGELIAVIGRNGIGKSTLLRTLAGLQKPIAGDILFDGRSISDYPRMELARKVGYISTEIIKVANMSVYDLVSLGRFPHTNWIGKVETSDQAVIYDAIAKTSMTPFAGKFISQLSDGERQKAMIARLLSQDTPIMVMDEPTAFLDVASKYEIMHLLHTLSNDSGKTIIYSTHDLQIATSQSDRIWLLLDDRLLEGAPEDLMLSGAFEHLFNSSSVTFNSEDGTFAFRSDFRGSIYIEGLGSKRKWTEKAVERSGFRVAVSKTNPYVVVPAENNMPWKLVTDKDESKYSSIYELIEGINNYMPESI
jgi:iron complex transport system ATP-binding protein